MSTFTLDRPRTLADVQGLAPGGEFIAGGTDMLQLLRERVRAPQRLVDLAGVLPTAVERQGDVLHIDAGVTMEALATHPAMADFPAVAQALLESASVQVRNLATVGGNLLQRTRCGYFRDAGEPACNKRRPGSGCAALHGENRTMAVFGTSAHCIATSASDFAVALTALDARVVVASADGQQRLALHDLYREPGDRPERETTLRTGDVITAIEIPFSGAAQRSIYVKVRDRASFEWALLSVAAGLQIEAGEIRNARVAMGGVGTVPWRMPAVEAALIGQAPSTETFRAAAANAAEGAQGYGHNDFKIAMIPRVLGRALELAGEAA